MWRGLRAGGGGLRGPTECTYWPFSTTLVEVSFRFNLGDLKI